MWMSYVQSREITDLFSGVTYLHKLFSHLWFDAQDEAMSSNQVNQSFCFELMQRYRRGIEYCKEYLNSDFRCIDCLIRRLHSCNLGEHLSIIQKFLPGHLQLLHYLPSEEELNSGETEDNEVYSQDYV